MSWGSCMSRGIDVYKYTIISDDIGGKFYPISNNKI